MNGLPLRMAFRVPVIATGTIGACPFSAMMNPPFLNGNRAPVRLRVPSGKIRNELPARSASAAPIDGREALLGVAPLERDEAGEIEGTHEHRQLAQLGFVENPQPRKERVQRVEQDGRLDIARVVDRVDRGAVTLDVLASFHAIADAAQPEAKTHAEASYAVENRRVADCYGKQYERRSDEQDVERNGDVRGERANRGDEGTHGVISCDQKKGWKRL